jgi:hypothetical protein
MIGLEGVFLDRGLAALHRVAADIVRLHAIAECA